MTINDIYTILGIKESFEIPTSLMSKVVNADIKERKEIFEKFEALGVDKSEDFFRDFFQEQAANRKDLKQDYTPNAICKILSGIIPSATSFIDVCAGTGSLSLAAAQRGTDGYIICEELSLAVIPILIFNFAFRNMNAIVKEKDVVLNEIKNIYIIESSEKYSNIKKVHSYDYDRTKYEPEKNSLIISNPPYSIGWNQKNDERFEGYSLPPKAKADYLFVLDAVSRLSEDGKAYFILPLGVLFRNAKEGEIRQQLIENNLIESVILLPDKLFMNTDIPTIFLVLNKRKTDKSVFIINASDEFVKLKSKNNISDEQINKIVETYNNKNEINGFSRVVGFEEIEKNEFNLNVPRYVMKEAIKEYIDYPQVIRELAQIKKEREQLDIKLFETLDQLYGSTAESQALLEHVTNLFSEYINS